MSLQSALVVGDGPQRLDHVTHFVDGGAQPATVQLKVPIPLGKWTRVDLEMQSDFIVVYVDCQEAARTKPLFWATEFRGPLNAAYVGTTGGTVARFDDVALFAE